MRLRKSIYCVLFLLQNANDQFFGKNHRKNVNFDAFVVVVTQSIYLNLWKFSKCHKSRISYPPLLCKMAWMRFAGAFYWNPIVFTTHSKMSINKLDDETICGVVVIIMVVCVLHRCAVDISSVTYFAITFVAINS